MKKQFTNKARYLGLKLTAIVFALLLISGQSWGQGAETFNNSTLSATYASGNFIGDNGFQWSYVQSRNESTYGINGKGIMFEGAITAKLTSASTSGGIGSFTCSLKKAFTGAGNRQVELFVNGTSKGTSITWDNTTVQTFTVPNINISGNVIIEIRNKQTKQVVIDDISWTGYASGNTAPTLTADASLNNVDNNIDISFTDDATWRGFVSAVKIGGTTLAAGDYTLSAGNLQLKPSNGNALLTTSGSKSVTVVATGYSDAAVTQVINAGVPTANSTATINLALAPNTSRTITCTAKDQYNNLVSGYTFKYDATITNSDVTTAESYTLDGTARTSTVSDINVVATTNASGVATFTAALPATIDGNDGVSIQVQLNDGTTNIGSVFSFSQLSSQTITFGALSAVTYGDAPFTVSATGGDSGNPVTFTSSNATVATCTGTNGSTITILKNGSCTINANQAGNASYNAAVQVGQTLTVNQKTLTLPDAAVQNKTYTGTNAAVITGTLTGIVGSDVVTLNGTGTFADVNVANGIAVTSTSTLSGANAAKYTLTQPTGLTANITPADQTITFAALANKTTADADFAPGATSATIGINAITYTSSNTSVATIVSGNIHIVGVGTTDITASQAASLNYTAANDVIQPLTVTKALTLLSAWTFDATAAAPNTPTSFASELGNQTGSSYIYLDGSNGSSTWASTASNPELTTFAGTTTNDPRGTQVAGNALTIANNSANGKNIIIKFSMTGYKDPVISFAIRGTSTGFSTHQWAWSTDNVSYTDFGSNTGSTTTSFLLKTLDMTTIDALDHANTVYIRLTPTGASASTGNNRIDNIVIKAMDDFTAPVISTTAITSIGSTTASSGGNITSNNGAAVTERGVCWNTTGSPTTSNNILADVSGGNGIFTSTITGLSPNTTYYLKAYATNSIGTSYGDVQTFTTHKATETVSGTSNFSALTNIGSETNITVSGDLTIDAIGECNNLTITSTGKITINPNTGLIVNGNLLLHSDASGTASLIHNAADLTVTGTTTIERYITGYNPLANPSNGWHLISSPVGTISTGAFIPGTNDDLYSYSEIDNEWKNYKFSAFGFTNGLGYLSAYETSGPRNFTGNINTTSVTLPNLSYNSAQGKGWHLLGNPYASAIEWNNSTDWALTNVSTTAKLLNGGGSYTDLAANDIIPAMQGFFVKVSDATNSITIPASARTHSTTTNILNKASQQEKLVLKASSIGNSTYVESTVKTNANATNGFDALYDANFLAGMYGAPQLYSIITNNQLSTNTIAPITSNLAIPMGFVAGLATNYKITADGLSNFTSCSAITLEDLKTNTTQNLMQNPVYNFTATTTDNANRFVLHFATSVGVNEIGKTNGGIYAYDNNIYVNNNEQIKQISVYNAMGQLIKTVNNVNGLQKINMNGHATGYYIVKVISDKNVYSEKVLIK